MKLSDQELATLQVALQHFRHSLPLFPHLELVSEFDNHTIMMTGKEMDRLYVKLEREKKS